MNKAVANLLLENGATIVGFADLGDVEAKGMPGGVVAGVAVSPNVIKNIADGPNKMYLEEYERINRLLNKLVILGADYIKEKGYKAIALTTEFVAATENKRAFLPVKTVATKAGLGWVGKNDLLVTKEFGSAIRFSSIITDAPFEYGTPVTQQECKDCTQCVDNCPANALYGTVWAPNTDRDKIVDVFKCSETAIKLCIENIGHEHQICGKCIEVCPFTKGYLKRSL